MPIRTLCKRCAAGLGVAFATDVLKGSALEGVRVTRGDSDIQALRSRFEEFDQGHVFRFWDQLTPESRRQLAGQAASLDLPSLVRGFGATQHVAQDTPKLEAPKVEALPEFGGSAA